MGLLGSDRQQRQDLVGTEPPQREREGLQGGGVNQVQVIDHQQDRPAGLQPTEQIKQIGADLQRVRRRPSGRGRPGQCTRTGGPGRPGQLLDHAEGQGGLGLLPLGGQHAADIAAGHEPMQQRGLADAGLPLDQDDPGLAPAGQIQLALEQGKLRSAANEERIHGSYHKQDVSIVEEAVRRGKASTLPSSAAAPTPCGRATSSPSRTTRCGCSGAWRTWCCLRQGRQPNRDATASPVTG
jgi:hypothetical protein